MLQVVALTLGWIANNLLLDNDKGQWRETKGKPQYHNHSGIRRKKLNKGINGTKRFNHSGSGLINNTFRCEQIVPRHSLVSFLIGVDNLDLRLQTLMSLRS